MKVQNLMKDTAYFGYEAHGFYLKTNEVSREMPPALAGNAYLRADAEAGGKAGQRFWPMMRGPPGLTAKRWHSV